MIQNEHPYWTVADWRDRASNGNTTLGYWEWVIQRRREADADPAYDMAMNEDEQENLRLFERDRKVAQHAFDTLHKECELEIDLPTAVVSEGDDNGAYVKAWVWVSFAGTEFDKEPVEVPYLAAVERHRRPSLGGIASIILPSDWRLYLGLQSTGSECLLDWGPEVYMRECLSYRAGRSHDVWLVAPDGTKHLPLSGEVEDA